MKYSIMFVVLFFLFKNKMQGSTVRTYRLIIIVLGSLAIVFFGVITFLRFDSSQVSQTSTTGGSLLSYLSQSYINFSTVFDRIPNGLSGGRAHFPLFFQGTSSKVYVELNLNTFSTCIGTWVKDNGRIFALVVTVVYAYIIRIIPKIKCNIFSLFYFAWAIEFALSAPFFYNDTINGSRFVSLVLIVLIDVLIRSSSKSQTKQSV